MRRAAIVPLVVLCLNAAGAAAAASGASGIAGKVVAGPTCPVQRYPPDPRCAPRPLAATLRIRRAAGGARAETVRSGSDGRFRVRLAAGQYVVTPLTRPGSPFPRPPAPTRVRVRAGHFTDITITYDTGIR